jgi:aminoglycoside phosphotransferase (APT) family kinase protein
MSDAVVAEKPKLQQTFHAIIPHPDPAELSILLCPVGGEGEGWALPSYEPEEGWFPEVGPFNRGLREQLGITVITLRCLKFEIDREVKKRVDAIHCMENLSPDWTPPGPMRWASREELAGLRLTIEEQRPVIEDWLAETASGTIPPRRVPWAVRGWYDKATGWVRGQLAERGVELTGPPEQIKQWGISSILRVPTNDGDYYLKAANSYFAREPAITRALSEMYPGQVPDPLAVLVEPEQGWMLMRDFGSDAHDLWDATPAQLEEVLWMYARMQIGCIERVDDLLASGFMDRRLDVLATQVDELLADPESLEGLTAEEVEKLRAAVPRVKEMCAQLESYGVPQTLSHGDFHGGNIIEKDGNYLIFDWTDACIAHPFLDLAVITGSNNSGKLTPEERDRLCDTYLEHWTAYVPMEYLREAARLALVLGALHQAVSYKQIIDSFEDAAMWEFAGATAQWLRSVLEI